MATAEKPSSKTGVSKPRPKVEVRRGGQRRPFTVDEYYKMARAGILKEDERLELIDGDILIKSDHAQIYDGDKVMMSPIGSPHGGCLKTLTMIFAAALGPRAMLSVQDPLRRANRSEPPPDFMLLKPREDRYTKSHPGPSDVLLLVEIMASSARTDRKRKLARYARAEIAEVWLVDLKGGQIEVYRQPVDGVYAVKIERRSGENVSPLAFPDVVLAVDAILG